MTRSFFAGATVVSLVIWMACDQGKPLPAGGGGAAQSNAAAVAVQAPRVQSPVTNQPASVPESTAAKVEIALTPEQEARFQTGKELYVTTCGACHQPNGNGLEGLAPPLADSEWVLGSVPRLVRMTLHGMRGPVTVKGKVYEQEMPALFVLNDDQIAALLTYIRREWGHKAGPVEPSTVARIRAETEDRLDPWTAEELLALPE